MPGRFGQSLWVFFPSLGPTVRNNPQPARAMGAIDDLAFITDNHCADARQLFVFLQFRGPRRFLRAVIPSQFHGRPLAFSSKIVADNASRRESFRMSCGIEISR